MGHLAKADGRVSEREIAVAEAVMTRLRLTVEQRRLAIDYFNEGKSQVLVLDQVLATLRQDCRGRGVLLRLFLDIQFQMAYADGPPGPVAKGQLLHIARHAGVSDAVFQGLDQMANIRRGAAGAGGAKARGRAGRGGAGTGHAASGRAESALAAAYALLGVPSTASESEVKRAYRRLLSQHHPDKLVSRGASPDMLKRADERTHQIRRAYETITQARAA
jgi:DnaJ like chaperone protein